jgi:hypothetical protein
MIRASLKQLLDDLCFAWSIFHQKVWLKSHEKNKCSRVSSVLSSQSTHDLEVTWKFFLDVRSSLFRRSCINNQKKNRCFGRHADLHIHLNGAGALGGLLINDKYTFLVGYFIWLPWIFHSSGVIDLWYVSWSMTYKFWHCRAASVDHKFWHCRASSMEDNGTCEDAWRSSRSMWHQIFRP